VTLTVEHLRVQFELPGGRRINAVSDVSFEVGPGRTLGLAGESGSGKSTILLTVLGLLPASAHVSGSVVWNGRELLSLRERDLNRIRWLEIAYVPQAAAASLNPVRRIGAEMRDVIERRGRASNSEMVIEATLREVGLPVETASRYPHQLSGGMKQRVAIATALLCNPTLLLVDEPTTALDVMIQAQVLRLLERLHHERGVSIVAVSHDLGVVAQLCERVEVMYGGAVLESGPTRDVAGSPRHPYTQLLVASIPTLEVARTRSPPRAVDASRASAGGCVFSARCPIRIAQCEVIRPQLRSGHEGRAVACHLVEDRSFDGLAELG
jgi:oligopeptide/dipeptide ABC transporter ATP-binding protein